jgi:polysaccharide biosynthesis/export protein
MRFLPKNRLTWWGLVGTIPLLAACAFAPGMRLEKTVEPVPSADSGVTPIFKSITPQLLQAEKAQREQHSTPAHSQLIAKPTPYLIGSGDIISIVVWNHPELSTPAMTGLTTITPSGTDSGTTPGFVVDQDGLVQFPYVERLKLAGLTEREAQQLLTDKLARYLKKPDLTLRVQAFRSKRVYIDGEVKTPGIQSINDIPMTLPEALNRAGGILPSGDQSRIEITRAANTYRVSLPQLVQNGTNPSDILLANGDTVRVVSRDESKVFVLGEVTKPIALAMRNGKMTLNEALGEAGGLNQLSAEGQQVYVVRNEANAATEMNPVVYNLDARSPVALALAENFELKPRDVVYVDPSSLTNWSRVVNLILPGALPFFGLVQATR